MVSHLRFSRRLLLLAILSLGVLAVVHIRQTRQNPPKSPAKTSYHELPGSPATSEQSAPRSHDSSHTHPIDVLMRNAESSWLSTLQKQSQSLEAAVTEYRRRYGVPPPPKFDKWYAFARSKNVQLIDDYDTIYHSLLPFRALAPRTIRKRTSEALGFGANNLMAVFIRDGRAALVEGGQEWLRDAIVGMIEPFVQHLPDMDLAFNIHDEPRVVVPHDELSHLVRTALDQARSATKATPSPQNAFSARPYDMHAGKRVKESRTTRFNVFAHQPVWLPSRLSCPIESPARDLYASADNRASYALAEMGFVYNQTAFSYVCNSPSLSSSHGFFDRPNAFNVVHELVPVFSQSKMSSFQDILYPSPWYWFEKVKYDVSEDIDWKAKESKLFWRGSTTGGFSRAGGWRRQHRQKLVGKINALDKAMVYRDVNRASTTAATVPEWKLSSVDRSDFQDSMDVHFSHIGQCDPGDCDAQREFFHIAPQADQKSAWKYRYLLDMDGNAFSGRFYAFLRSRSLTLKMAVFREWHEEWIKPWVHYIPVSLAGDEVLETVRYLSGEPEGQKQGARMAQQGTEWANKALRKEDLEVWFFRLLLECVFPLPLTTAAELTFWPPGMVASSTTIEIASVIRVRREATAAEESHGAIAGVVMLYVRYMCIFSTTPVCPPSQVFCPFSSHCAPSPMDS